MEDAIPKGKPGAGGAPGFCDRWGRLAQSDDHSLFATGESAIGSLEFLLQAGRGNLQPLSAGAGPNLAQEVAIANLLEHQLRRIVRYAGHHLAGFAIAAGLARGEDEITDADRLVEGAGRDRRLVGADDDLVHVGFRESLSG